MIRGLRVAAAMAAAIATGIAPAQAEEKPRALTSYDALSALVTNTWVYAKPGDRGATFAVYLRPDGTGLATSRDGRGTAGARPIEWTTLTDQRVCIADVGSKPWEGDCGTLTVEGDNVVLTPAQGPAWPGTVLQGDAWSLDAPARTLSGRAAVEALISNTFQLIAVGSRQAATTIYLMPDGTVRRVEEGLDDGGVPEFTNWVLQPPEKWRVRESDGGLCIADVEPGAGRPDFCAMVSLIGDTVIFRNDRPYWVLYGTLLPGDAEHLSPAAVAAVKAVERRLVGNTLAIAPTPERGEVAVYFRPNGAGRANQPERNATSGSRAARWLMRLDGTLCVTVGGARFNNQDCSAISITGDTVTLTRQGTSSVSGRILYGNARKL